MLTRIVVDRPATDAVKAMGGAWAAFVIALPFLEPGMGPVDVAVGALAAAGLVLVGFAATSRVRPMPSRQGDEQLRLAWRSLVLGALIGIANLGVNLGMAALDPTVRQLLVERFGQISPWTSSFAGPVIEEVVFRLFFMSAVALAIARFVQDPAVVFWTALAVSAAVFGALHVLRPMPESLELAWIYSSGITLKSGLGGVVLGWIFWRWGLGHAMACHFAANSAHLLLEPLVLAS